MAGLGDTVAELMRNAKAAAQAGAASGSADDRLVESAGFGPNPGALRMWIHRPDGLPDHAPLVVVLHGCGQTAAGYAAGSGWLELADRYGFAVLCPEQVRANNANLCFNWFEDADIARGSGEAASIAQMVRHALKASTLDASRVFVTGLSAGGAMAAAMLATYPEMFAGGAVIAGLPYGAASGVGAALGAMRSPPELSANAWGDKVRGAAPAPARYPNIAIWHGDADTTVAPAAARALGLQWCDVHGVTRSTPGSAASPRHQVRECLRADGTVAVSLHSISGLGHGTPVAATGEDGCGTPAPWILEAGVSSSLEMVRSWKIDGAGRRARPAGREAARREAVGPAPAWTPTPSSSAAGVGETIARALRAAGLTR